MKSLVSIELDTISQQNVIADLKQYGEKATKAIWNAVNRTALATEDKAKKRLKGMLGSAKHWITGRLAASVHAELKGKNTFASVKDSEAGDGNLNIPFGDLEAIVGTNVEYGPKIEHEYDSFLRFAAEMEAKNFEKRIIEELNKIK